MQTNEEPSRKWRLIDVVVLAIAAAIVVALMLPMLNDQRVPARRNQCAVNIRHLARAAIQYELRSKQLPGYVNDFGWFAGTTDPASLVDAKSSYRSGDKKLSSWVVPLLGFLDAQPTYEIWSAETFPLLGINSIPTTVSVSVCYNRLSRVTKCLIRFCLATFKEWFGMKRRSLARKRRAVLLLIG